MTAIEKAHFLLEIGKTLEEILTALDELEEAHQNWLLDAKDVLEQDNDFGTFTISIEDILKVRDSFLEDDFCATYFGIKQLDLLFFRRRHFFDDAKSQEEHLGLILREGLQVFNQYADPYVDDKLNAMSEQERQKFLAKLRKWSLLRGQGANTTNEISALICKESTSMPHPVLFEVSLSKEIYYQANYQRKKHSQDLSEDKKRLLDIFVKDFESAELQSWKI